MIAKALVVEDSATQARIVGRMVEAQGWESVHCATIEAALDALKLNTFQAVFLDVFIGTSNALDYLQAFRALAPQCPIVVMTAGSKKETVEETLAAARKANADFVIRKPFDTDEVAGIIAAAYHDLETRRRKKHVLVIDDSATILRLASGILAGAGYHVSTAETMEDAFERIDIAGLHLAIVDIYMPGIGGLEGIKRLRSVWPMLKLIAISAGTASGDAPAALADAVKLGADAELAKPFDKATLVALADSLIA